ncbi:hypothetical protein G6011_09283 [Alternaria panax]|uniref:Uncharacterized protein n=1 Tax=Alternaria panax TaxID=48097 RepID=A0AAD4IAQ7_9PLEO|nr:hypothetical protein G6011_09283 [Alternaria panax]
MSQIKQTGSMLDDPTLEYVAVIIKGTVYNFDISANAIETARQIPRRLKTALSLQPEQTLLPADLAKEEMIARYAKDDYYFLGDYIDIMTEESCIEVYNGLRTAAYVW